MSEIRFPYGLTPPVSVAQGGTGSNTALSNNRVMVSSSGAIAEAAAITGSRALASSASGIPVHSAVTATELGYLSGVTSAVQTQFSKAPTWTKYSVSHTALQVAAVINDIQLFSLVAKGVIHKVIIKNTAAFAGTTTYTLSVGIVGNLVKYIAVVDVTTAVSNTNFSVAATTINEQPEDFGAATSIRLSAVSTIQNLDQSTQGAADIYVLTSLLP